MTATFSAKATVSASTKRATISSGKRGTATTNLSGLSCTPLDPVDADLASRAGLSTPVELLQTFVQSDSVIDIKNGDLLTVASVDYPIRAIWDYSNYADGEYFVHLILEDVKS